MYFKRGPRCRGPPCKIYPLLLFQLVIRGDAGLVKNRIMYAPDINGRRLFSACLRREGGRGGGGGEGRGNKSGIPPPWKTGEGKEWSGNFEGVSVSVSRLVKFDRIIMLLYGNRIENRSVFRNEGRRELVRLDEIISFFFSISVFRDFVFGDFLFFFFFRNV